MKRFPCFRVLAFTALFVAVACMATEAQQQRGGQRAQRGEGGGQRKAGGGQRGPGMRGPGMGGVAGLLRSEQVQKEVKITEDQKSQLTKMAEEQGAKMRERFAGLKGENREELSDAERQTRRQEFMKEFQELAKKTEEKIKGILESEQFKRLKQIELQQQGVEALRRPDVAQALGLSEEQIKELKEVFEGVQKQREELRQQRESIRGGFRDASEDEQAELRKKAEELGAKSQNLQKELQKNAMGLLNDEQKGKLKGMMGEPFELDRRSMFGRGRGGGQRQGGGQGGQRGGQRDGNRPARPQS